MVEINYMQNNKIGIITTSAPIKKLDIDIVRSGYTYLVKNGFEVFEHPSCQLENGYMAGNVDDRVAAIHDLVKDKTVDIIMAFWGGDNTNQLLDKLDYDLIKNNPKIFIGYSDTSSLLNAIHEKTGLVTYLGPAVITFCKPNIFPESIFYFKKVVSERGLKQTLVRPTLYAKDAYYKRSDNQRIIESNDGWKVLRHGVVSDKKIVAICLSMLQSLLSTPYEPDLKGKVLFCEIDEAIKIEAFDRMVVQLKQTGILDTIAAFVFSKATDESNINEIDIVKVLEENIKNDIPIIYNFDCGHTDPIITIPVGGYCDINTKDGVSISVSY